MPGSARGNQHRSGGEATARFAAVAVVAASLPAPLPVSLPAPLPSLRTVLLSVHLAMLLSVPLSVLAGCSSSSDDGGQISVESPEQGPTSAVPATRVQRPGPDGPQDQRIAFEAGRPYTEVAGTVLAGLASDHVLDGEAGQVVLVSFARRPSGTVSLTMRAPDGRVLADAVPEAVVELPQSGRYRLSVNGAAETEYTLYVTKSTGSTVDAPERITLETASTIDGTSAPGEMVQYEFAAAGRQLGMQVFSPSGRFLTSARTSDGAVWLSFAESAFSGEAEIIRTVPVSGTHVVSLLSLGAVDPTADSDYELRLRLLEPGELAPGELETGNLEPGEGE